jgi:hypothetical protein
MYPLYPIHNTFFQNVQNSHPGRTFQALDSKRRREVLREFLEAVVLSLPTTVFLFGTIHGLQAARLAALSKAKCEVKNKFQKTGKGWKDGKGKKHKKKEKRCSGLTPHLPLRPPSAHGSRQSSQPNSAAAMKTCSRTSRKVGRL